MAAEMELAQTVFRDVIFRLVLLSATLVGFSATLLSIEQLDFNVDRDLLRASWLLFAAVIFLGPLLVYVETRAR
jgi:hypothetical protein